MLAVGKSVQKRENSREENQVHDLILLEELNEEIILSNVKKRHEKDLIYTYIGSILISVNPYRILKSLFTLEVLQTYNQGKLSDLPPHLFAIAQNAYNNLFEFKKNQSILISGESGSGKTESTKLIIQYLASITGKQNEIDQMLVEVNPILESFGNAKTIRNSNSSRFGKFIEVYFDENNEGIVGSRIKQYLLEKSRVVSQAQNERNYHIFYQLCAGADKELIDKCHLNKAETYRYLNQGKSTKIEGMDDEEEFEQLKNAFFCLNVSSEQQDFIFGILSAILHLGNIDFKTDRSNHTKVKNSDLLGTVSQLLSIEPSALERCLAFKTIEVKNQKLVLSLNLEQAIDNRDMLAKALYERLFKWLVEKINSSLLKKSSDHMIGILDIFGFENFDANSFEQFCINYCNEKLHNMFTHYIFVIEQQEYQKEKLEWKEIEFIDNVECLNLIEKKPLGILYLLDEECRLPKTTDESLLKKLHTHHQQNAYYKNRLTQSQTHFTIRHYAGEVSYNIKGFLEKSKHTLQQDIIDLYIRSRNPLISSLFSVEREDSDIEQGTLRRGTRMETVGYQFKKQLDDLIFVLESTSINFIRCIKPNQVQKGNNFDEKFVMEQLRYLGILETVKIRKAGFAYRFSFEDFYRRYYLLNKNAGNDLNHLLKQLNMPPDQWEKGQTKIFLRQNEYNRLEMLRNHELQNRAIIIQKNWRMWTVWSYYSLIKSSAIRIQAWTRRWILVRNYSRTYDAVLILQSFARMMPKRIAYLKARKLHSEKERNSSNQMPQEQISRPRSQTLSNIMVVEKKEQGFSPERKPIERRRRSQTISTNVQAKLEKSKEETDGSIKAVRASRMTKYGSIKDIKLAKKLAPTMQTIQPGTIGQTLKLGGRSSRKFTGSFSRRPSFSFAADLQSPVFVKLSAKKEESSGQSLEKDSVVVQDDIADYPFSRFASRFFQEQSVGPFRRKKVAMHDLISFSDRKLRSSLLKLSTEDSKTALEIWTFILTYMGLIENKQTTTFKIEAEEQVLSLGINRPLLRNEIYCQICKQITKNPEIASLQRAWELMATCTVCFSPNHLLMKYLACFLTEHSNDKNSMFSEYAQHCLKQLQSTTRKGSRNLVPTVKELVAIKTQKTLPIPILLMDGYQLVFDFTPGMTVGDIFNDIVRSVGLQSGVGFALYEISNELERSLSDDEYIGDILSKWENYKQVVMLGKGINVEFHFLFKKQLYLPNFRADPVDYDLFFHQAFSNIVRSNWPCNKDVAVTLAAIRHLYLYDKQAVADEVFFEMVDQYIPRNLLYLHQPEEWGRMIQEKMASYKGKTVNELVDMYIQIVSSLPLYGSTSFSVHQNSPVVGWENLPSSFDLSVNVEGVKFLRSENKETLYFYDYDHLQSWTYTESVFKLEFYNCKEKEITVSTMQGIEIAHLIEHYYTVLSQQSEYARAIKESDPQTKPGQINLLPFKVGDIIRIEWKRNDTWFLGVCNNSSGVFQKENVRLIIGDPEKLKTSVLSSTNNQAQVPISEENLPTVERPRRRVTFDEGATYDMKDIWEKKCRKIGKQDIRYSFEERLSYQSKPIIDSLFLLKDDHNHVACEVFTSILRYIGETPRLKSDLVIAQEIVQAGIDTPEIRNEIYVQLCKQTQSRDDHKCLRVWELFQFVSASFAPLQDFLPYVQAWIQASTNTETISIVNASAYTLEILNKTVSKHVLRSLAPGLQEMEALRLRQNLQCEIYLQDKSSRKIPVDSATTVDEALLKFVKFIGLKNDSSFGLFEVLSKYADMYLRGDLYICDLLRRFEDKKGKSKHSARLLFKKRIFFSLEKINDPAEMDLIFAESLHCVLAGEFPIKEDLATHLAALQLQIKYGDHDPKKTVLTEKNLKEYVPRDVLENLNLGSNQKKSWIDTIKLYWVSLSGKSSSEAKSIYLKHMKEFPLFGSLFFFVEQRKKPKKIFIAFNRAGIHIVDHQTKESISHYKWEHITNWRYDPGHAWHFTAGSLIKPEKLSFFTKHPEAIDITCSNIDQYVREELNPTKWRQSRKSTQLKLTAQERIQEAKRILSKRKSGMGSEAIKYFNFEDVRAKIVEKPEDSQPKLPKISPKKSKEMTDQQMAVYNYYEKQLHKGMFDIMKGAKVIEMQLISKNQKDLLMENCKNLANSYKTVKKMLIRFEDKAEFLSLLNKYDNDAQVLITTLQTSSVGQISLKGFLPKIQSIRKYIASIKSFASSSEDEQTKQYKLLQRLIANEDSEERGNPLQKVQSAHVLPRVEPHIFSSNYIYPVQSSPTRKDMQKAESIYQLPPHPNQQAMKSKSESLPVVIRKPLPPNKPLPPPPGSKH